MKLKIVKQRADNQKEIEAGDLRCSVNDPLIANSFPYACLSVKGVEASLASPTIKKFDLEISKSDIKNVFHIVTRLRTEGEHSIQTLTLMATTLEFLEGFPEASFCLFEINQLYVRLAFALGERGKHEMHTPAGHIRNWSAKIGHISIEPPCQLHLYRAGFSIDPQIKTIELGASEVQKIRDDLFDTGKTVGLREVVGE